MTTQKNGATLPTNGKKIETTLEVAVVKKEVPALSTGETPALEDRLLRINQLFELQTRYNRLQKSQNKLNEFKMKKGDENISLTISDRNNREEFTTSNPELINEVLNCVRVTVQDKKKLLEPLLKW